VANCLGCLDNHDDKLHRIHPCRLRDVHVLCLHHYRSDFLWIHHPTGTGETSGEENYLGVDG
jgi:hypothetical protein